MFNIKYCEGCRDDYYNDTTKSGCLKRRTNSLCWMIKISIHQRPPYKGKKQRIPSCWGSDQFVAIDPEKSLDKDGYWK